MVAAQFDANRPLLLTSPPIVRSRLRNTRTWVLLIAVCSLYLLLKYVSFYQTKTHDEVSRNSHIYQSSDASNWVLFQPPPPVTISQELKPGLPLPLSCVDAHIANGASCHVPNEPKLDVLWAWVNGSDDLSRDARARIENDLPLDHPYRPYNPEGEENAWRRIRQYRERDELRFSTRSILEYFRPYTDHLQIITNDMRMPDGSLEYRIGQAPQWLDLNEKEWIDGDIRLDIKHLAHIFTSYNDTTFNSLGVESQFGHMTDISEHFIYMSDDMFFMNDLTPRTFYTSAYGLVFRMQSNWPMPLNQDSIGRDRGQRRSLGATNNLLGKRFGIRHRPYVDHQAEAASLSLLHEIDTIWANQWAKTASHPFRETQSGDSDPSIMFMLVHFTIERWREALLWSWVIGKHGGLDDSWTREIMDAAWEDLGGLPGEFVVNVRARSRETLNPARVEDNLRKSGMDQPDHTRYEFSSLDGYPYATFKESEPESSSNKWAVYYGGDEDALPKCTISFETCFTDKGNPFTSASNLFKNIAFKELECGDCITIALVAASGALGLEAFLPSPERTAHPSLAKFRPSPNDAIPHLPLTEHWEDSNFALTNVIAGPMNVREWTVQLLQRYRFIIGDSPSHFAKVSGPGHLVDMMLQLEARPETTLLCVNDDITVGEVETSVIFKYWANDHWGTPAQWEQGEYVPF